MDPQPATNKRSAGEGKFMTRGYFLALAVIWTLIVGFSFARVLQLQTKFEKESALVEARSVFERDAGYFYWLFAWNSAPSSAGKLSGLGASLDSLCRPAALSSDTLHKHYSMPELAAFEVIPRPNERYSRLISLNPINPANQPDEWEREALLKLAAGEKEYSAVEQSTNGHNLRYIGALPGNAACLLCHESSAGEHNTFNAGISLSIPFNPIRRLSGPQVLFAGFNHLFFWLLGLSGLVFGWKRLRIAERREALLKCELLRIRSAVECATEAIMLTDNSGCAVYINPAFTRLFGQSLESLRNGGIDKLYADRDVTGKISEIMASGVNLWEGEVQMLSGDRREITAWCLWSRIFDGGGCSDGMRFLFSDITESKKRQEELIQSEKLSATLELAGAACHEINQPLQTALGYCDMALMDIESNSGDLRRTEAINTVREQVLRVADIVKKLNGIARYRTAGYVGKSRIVDLEESSRSGRPG